MERNKIVVLLTLLLAFSFNAYSFTISGTVSDEKGDPCIGATVKVKGIKKGTITDYNGNYTIKVDSLKGILVFSYLGYENQEEAIKGRSIINVRFKEKVVELEELVVTGYGVSVKRSDVVSAVSSIATEGSPDSDVRIRVRGGSTLTADMSPAEYKAPLFKESSETPMPIPSGAGSIPIKAGTLTAGEINDFSKWTLWNDKSQEELSQFKDEWKIFPFTRYSVMVQNQDEIPQVNVEVRLLDAQKQIIWITKTDNNGRAELWANMYTEEYSKDEKFIIQLTNGAQVETIKNVKEFHEGINHVKLQRECIISNEVDAVFMVDATGSMQDEIAYLKTELNDVITVVKEKNKDLDLNLGSVFYRDAKDEYLTRVSDLSSDISQTIDFIKEQTANGGGDTPEAVEVALDSTLNQLSWRSTARTKLLFMVLDAPPHLTPEVLEKLQKLIAVATKKGIRLIPIAGSGIDKTTEYLMRSMALSTNGTYVFLTDDSKVGNPHIKPTTDKYDVEKLNDLLVRLFTQYTAVVSCDKALPKAYKEEKTDSTVEIKGKVETKLDTINIKTDSVKLKADTLQKDSGKVIETPDEIFECKFFPNPTTGILNIKVKGDIMELFFTDMTGKILQRIAINKREEFQEDLSDYPRGVYMISYIVKNRKVASGKIILTH